MNFGEIVNLLKKSIPESTNADLVARLGLRRKQQARLSKDCVDYFILKNEIDEIQEKLEARAN